MENDLSLKDLKIVIIGLGYVGFPLAVEFSKKYKVVGYDLDSHRIEELIKGYDRTNEIDNKLYLNSKNLKLTSDESNLKNNDVYIITVPTPVDANKIPDLNPLKNASELAAANIDVGNFVIYESTVYPGCTEEVCVPILEKKSGLKYNEGFFCGYSPERINPGDKKHTLTNIKKITSGSNVYSSNIIDTLYKSIISAGTYCASSIMVAEAAKVIENTQRDVNIALINELSIIFNRLNLDTNEVLKAAETKWNFLPFRPGLVGGHCIGVDPYYLTHKAVEVGYHPEIILAGRRINDNMGNFVVENTLSELANIGVSNVGAKVAILGLAFKENCPDLRNTKVITIIERLKYYQCQVIISDEWVDPDNAKNIYDIDLIDLKDIKNQDAIIIAVGHQKYFGFSSTDWDRMFNSKGVLTDVKSIYDKNYFSNTNIKHWRL